MTRKLARVRMNDHSSLYMSLIPLVVQMNLLCFLRTLAGCLEQCQSSKSPTYADWLTKWIRQRGYDMLLVNKFFLTSQTTGSKHMPKERTYLWEIVMLEPVGLLSAKIKRKNYTFYWKTFTSCSQSFERMWCGFSMHGYWIRKRSLRLFQGHFSYSLISQCERAPTITKILLHIQWTKLMDFICKFPKFTRAFSWKARTALFYPRG